MDRRSTARRAYKQNRRLESSAQTRASIVQASRELLAGKHGPAAFTIDAVAKQAGVGRMTVYHHFESKRAVLEALFDELANRGLVPHLPGVIGQRDPRKALPALIHAFAAFWHSERVVLRRARALAALDAEIDESVRARDERRRDHLRRIVGSFPPPMAKRKDLPAVIDTLHVLTSFETFDGLMTRERSFAATTDIIQQLGTLVIEARSAG